MNRINEIELFLERIKNLCIQNPNIIMSPNMFYHELEKYDYHKTEVEVSLDGMIDDVYVKDLFPSFVERYNGSNLDVFCSINQRRFLQFQNNSHKCIHGYKLYLSIPKEYFSECACLIFDFIESKKMSSLSKIADCIRSDDIVLRLESKEAALEVINFVNNNITIMKSARRTNPFLVRFGVVGCAYDHYMSYNTNVCYLLDKYFSHAMKNNMLSNVCLDDFKKFLLDFKNSMNNQEILNDLISNRQILYVNNRGNGINKLVNFYETLILIETIALNGNVTINDYINQIEKFKNSEYEQLLYEKFDNILNPQNEVISDDDIKKQILDAYIELALDKYGYPLAFNYLNMFMRDNNYKHITRTNNLRNYFEQNKITSDDIIKITDNNPISYYRLKLLKDVCILTYSKYGYKQLYRALCESYLNYDFQFFTNGGEKQYREKLQMVFTLQEYSSFLKGLMKDDSIDSIVNIVLDDDKSKSLNT